MPCRTVTIAREFGSGGATIASLVAQQLGWTLLDACIIDEVAQKARVASKVAAECDERVDSWVHRFSRGTVVAAVLSAGAPAEGTTSFDSETMSRFSSELIRKAHDAGNCVIVGRGGQCALRGCADVLHVFVYGSVKQKLARLEARFPGRTGLKDWMHVKDAERDRYIRQYFGQTWDDRRLYNLMLCSDFGDEHAARLIVSAAGN